MKRTNGNWLVTRNCCMGGNCEHCRGVTPYGQARRVVQASGYGKRYAEWVAGNWKSYNAMAEKDSRA